jgi:hypothetical protein
LILTNDIHQLQIPFTQFRNTSGKTLNQLIAGMRVNISKSKLFVEQIEYLRYWITRQGIQPKRNKVEINAILNIKSVRDILCNQQFNFTRLEIIH